jgi:hypothetical protein
MLLSISRLIADFTVLATRLTTEDLADEQRVALIDQFIRHQGFVVDPKNWTVFGVHYRY